MESTYQAGYDQGVLITGKQYDAVLETAKRVSDAESKRLKQESDLKYGELQTAKALVDERVSILAGELRKRPKREASASTCYNRDEQTTTTITGASLPQEDAEFLIWEAARAMKVQEERDFYYGELQRIYEAHQRSVDRLDGTSPNTKPVP